MRGLPRQAQVFDAGIATKRAPGEHSRRKIKRLGHDQREIDLLTCQHDLVDECRALFYQALSYVPHRVLP